MRISPLIRSTAQNFTIAGICIAIGMALLPFIVSRTLFHGAVNAKYFFILTGVSICALHYAYLVFRGKVVPTLRGRWLLGGLGALLCVHYLASIFSVDPEHSLFSDIIRSTGVLFITYITFFAFYVSEVLTSSDWRIVRRAIVISSAIFALLSFFGFDGFKFFDGRFFSITFSISGLTFGSSTFAGTYLAIAFFLSLSELMHAKRQSAEWYAFLISSAVIFFSPMLFNIHILRGMIPFPLLLENPVALLGVARASSAVVFMGLGYLIIQAFLDRIFYDTMRKSLRWLWTGICVIGVIVPLALLFIPGSIVQQAYIKASTGARIIVWEGGFEAFKERPLLGWGPENFGQAFNGHFDNRLYLSENIGEIWFDRAHNVFIDTLVTMGAVGVVVSVLVFFMLFVVLIRASRGGFISDTEVMILTTLCVAHIVQLQTSFDTVSSYTLLAVVFGYVLWLERVMTSTDTRDVVVEQSTVSPLMNYIVGTTIILLVILGLWGPLRGEYQSQRSLFHLFVSKENAQQKMFIGDALSGVFDFESLRLSSASLIRTVLTTMGNANDRDISGILKISADQLQLYETFYIKYLAKHPDNYRARMNYAHVLMVQTVLGTNRLDEAKKIIADSYRLSPQNPLTYALDALASLYAGRLADAKAIIQQGIDINPAVDFTHAVRDHIIKQEKTFPTISIMKLENL